MVIVVLFQPPDGLEFGYEDVQHARLRHDPAGRARTRALHQPFQFGLEPFGHDVEQTVGLFREGGKGVLFDLEFGQPAVEAEGLEHANRIVQEGGGRSGPDDPVPEVRKASGGIVDPVLLGVVADGVDGEIPALEVGLKRSAFQSNPVQAHVVQGDPVGRRGLFPKGHDPAVVALGEELGDLERAERGKVEVPWRDAEGQVADGAPDEVHGIAPLRREIEDGRDEGMFADASPDFLSHGAPAFLRQPARCKYMVRFRAKTTKEGRSSPRWGIGRGSGDSDVRFRIR